MRAMSRCALPASVTSHVDSESQPTSLRRRSRRRSLTPLFCTFATKRLPTRQRDHDARYVADVDHALDDMPCRRLLARVRARADANAFRSQDQKCALALRPWAVRRAADLDAGCDRERRRRPASDDLAFDDIGLADKIGDKTIRRPLIELVRTIRLAG